MACTAAPWRASWKSSASSKAWSGHTEPSGTRCYLAMFKRFPGCRNGDLEIAEQAWAFFKDKSLRDFRSDTLGQFGQQQMDMEAIDETVMGLDTERH